MRFIARLDMYHPGLSHPFKDAGVVADGLTGTHNAMVLRLFFVNKNCMKKGF
jgi:hypothetical protein